jgi:hypothetical protein
VTWTRPQVWEAPDRGSLRADLSVRPSRLLFEVEVYRTRVARMVTPEGACYGGAAAPCRCSVQMKFDGALAWPSRSGGDLHG